MLWQGADLNEWWENTLPVKSVTKACTKACRVMNISKRVWALQSYVLSSGLSVWRRAKVSQIPQVWMQSRMISSMLYHRKHLGDCQWEGKLELRRLWKDMEAVLKKLKGNESDMKSCGPSAAKAIQLDRGCGWFSSLRPWVFPALE